MTEDSPQPHADPPQAERTPRRLSVIWLAPAFALAVVAWLSWHTLMQRGPAITIRFTSAEGLTAGETEIRHKGVRVGTVESFVLSPDLSEVIVHARMTREVSAHLTASTRFWIVTPRVGTSGISGLNTLVSGAYIEMYPGEGDPQRDFVGLEDPPLLQPDTPGRAFTLTEDELGAIGPGTPVNYRGVQVGQVEGYALDGNGKHVNIYAFVRAPYDALVRDDTRFWDASAIDVSAGPQGIRVRLNSLQQLVTGAIGFDTPLPAAPAVPTESVGQAIAQQAAGRPLAATSAPGAAPEAAADKVFPLYENQTIALRNHSGPRLYYTLRFDETAAGLQSGTPVQLRGVEVGEVTQAQLVFDAAAATVYESASMSIDPSAVQLVGVAHNSSAAQLAAIRAGMAHLIARGLRAQLVTANFLTGQKVIALDIAPDAAAVRFDANAATPQFPTTHGADVDAILQSLQNTLHHLDAATAGPALGNAVKNLDATMSHLEQITREVQPQIKPLVASLRATADAAQAAAQSANGAIGPDSALASELPGLLQQVSEAARSIRELAEFLDRHPEALLRGRHETSP
ncbi:MAG TPA: MlaD family protein [Steroidobacteraceae bacterium]|jgi:paraquat-inducible protein B|nr:MlaD family protein [Steroidobacteraceae bacterium]